MGKIFETRITRFDGGILEDKRAGWVGSIANGFTTRFFSLTKHFNTFDFFKKLVPYYKTEADEDKDYDIVKFLYAPYETGYRLYGLGAVAGATHGHIYIHDDDLTALGWTLSEDAASNNQLLRNDDVFFYYKNFLYWWANGDLMRYVTNTVSGHNVSRYKDLSLASGYTVAQPVHHPADDIAYFFANNVVYSLNDTTWATALTLPSHFKIVSACPYGNYLAIGCVTLQTLDKQSVVFLWDRDSSLTTLTERIDFGEGEIRHLANLNNKLTAVMDFYLNNVTALAKGKILIKQASGNFAVTLNEILTDTTLAAADVLPKTRFITENKLYFPTKATLNSDTRLGIWVVDEYGKFTLDFVEEEATTYEGIYRLGNTWWIAHSADGSVNRTDDNRAYGHTSIYELLIFSAGDSSLVKELKGVTVACEKLPAAGQIVLKYRTDGATTWTTIFTATTDDILEHSAINIEATGAVLPQYKELELQILSTGGAVITGLNFKSELIPSKLY